MFYLTIVIKRKRNCHSCLARQYFEEVKNFLTNRTHLIKDSLIERLVNVKFIHSSIGCKILLEDLFV